MNDPLAALLHNLAIACEQHAPYRVGSTDNADIHGVHAARLRAAGVTVGDAGLREAQLESFGDWLVENGLDPTRRGAAVQRAGLAALATPAPPRIDVERLTRWRDALVMANCPDPDKYPEDAEAHLAALDDITAALDEGSAM